MKKSMLLSTTITVIVLILALSTATFAWFTVSGTATVTSSTFIAQSGDNLQIASATFSDDIDGEGTDGYTIGTWGNTYTLASFTSTFVDISSADGTTFYKEDATVTTAGYYTDYFYLSSGKAATLYLSTSSAVKATNSALTQDTLLRDSIRIAIYAGDSLVMYWAPTTEGSSSETSLISIDSDYTDGTTEEVSTSVAQNGALSSNFALASYDTATLQEGVLFKVVIWMEGTDEDCTSEAANGSISVSLNFTINSTDTTET